MPVSTGDKIGRYEVEALLGAGGIGEVCRAIDIQLGRSVALKILPPALATDAQYMARFEREAQILAALNHRNIAAIYGIEQGAIVMELVEGETLPCPAPLPTRSTTLVRSPTASRRRTTMTAAVHLKVRCYGVYWSRRSSLARAKPALAANQPCKSFELAVAAERVHGFGYHRRVSGCHFAY